MLRKVFGVAIIPGILALVASGASGSVTALAGPVAHQPARQAVPRVVGFPLARIGLEAAAADRYVRVDGSPGVQLAANPRTASVYVPVKCTDPVSVRTCDATASHVIDVINNAACNARGLSGCAVVAAAVSGEQPVTAAIDQRTDTVYVGDAGGSGSVSVVDGARCNASMTSGCAKPLATIKLASAPDAEALDPTTGTLYVASLAGKVFVINAGQCNSTTTAGCGQPVHAVRDRLGPDALGVNAATDTVYAANAAANEQGDTVSVIDGAICNASRHSGCGQTPATVTVGSYPDGIAVDEPADTVYVTSYYGADMSVINGATCNATITTGCASKPASVLTGDGASGIWLDASLHTVYVLNQVNDTMSEISSRACTGAHPAGCPADARNEQLPFNPPQGANPNTFALEPVTGTVYLANAGGNNFAENTAGGENYVEPVNIGRCSALTTSGCRHEAPSITDNFYIQNVDPATHTLYAGDSGLPQIDVINLATCHVHDLSGCAPVATIPAAHPYQQVGAIDDQTHTLYAGDVFSDTVAVINTATCNAIDTAGCSARPPTFKTGLFPGAPVLNSRTHTLYIPAGGTAANKIDVVSTAACNAENRTACGQHQASITVGGNTFLIDLSTKTDTIYAPSLGIPFGTGDTVDVINGARCNASNHSGCGHIAAAVRVGLAPEGVAVDDAKHSVYVGNGADGLSPGTLSVINTRTCNGVVTSGCTRPMPTVAVGRAPEVVLLDPRTQAVYVANQEGATVSIVNARKCNAGNPKGCAAHPGVVPTGYSRPQTISVDDLTGSVYVTISDGFTNFSGLISVLPAAP